MPTVLHPQLLFYHSPAHLALHSFPTRRSSDLPIPPSRRQPRRFPMSVSPSVSKVASSSGRTTSTRARRSDRKSTRLNSSHRTISYAVFCLKKKKNIRYTSRTRDRQIGNE